jgi:hypothetical protein
VRLLLVVALSAAALSVLAAGCGGGGDENPAASWADGFCSSINTWTDDVKSSVDSLRGGNLSKESLDNAAQDVGDSTDTLESDLKDLGPPETSEGQQAQDAVNTLSTSLKTGVQNVTDAFEGASGTSELLAAASTATQAVATMTSQIQQTFTTLEGLNPAGELKSALDDSSDCQDLTQSLQGVTTSSS